MGDFEACTKTARRPDGQSGRLAVRTVVFGKRLCTGGHGVVRCDRGQLLLVGCHSSRILLDLDSDSRRILLEFALKCDFGKQGAVRRCGRLRGFWQNDAPASKLALSENEAP